MEKEVKRIVDKIKKEYKPEKIYIFGSFAYGKPHKDSDLDLFIVKNTKKNRGERYMDVGRMILDREMPVDILVYTPGEVKKRIELGDFFVKKIINQGKLVYENK